MASFSSTLPAMAGDLPGESTVSRDSSEISVLDRVAVIYLALPVLIFLMGWLRLWVGLPVAGLLVWALCGAMSPRAAVPPFPLTTPMILAVLVAIAWTSLGGAGHLFYANFDWYTRDAVLRDLVIGEWPVAYERAGAAPMLLRAPIAYYLPAALMGKLFGVASADIALLAWTALGVVLFLMMAVSGIGSFWRALAVLAVLVFFSGMDLVGTVLRGGLMLAADLTPMDHLEWWGQRYQYSSHTTQLFWVPNHALPGWLATMLLLRNHEKTNFMSVLPVVVALIPLWSPLTALGFLPFAAVAFARHVWTHAPRVWLAGLPLVASIAIVAATGLYLTADSSAISSGATRVAGEAWWFYVPHHLQFVLLEAGILWLLLISVRRDIFLWTAGAILLVLPALLFGPSNDLVMRGSIPALVVLAYAAADTLRSPALALQRRVYWPIIVVLLLGAPTAVTEMMRAILEPSWKPDLYSNLVEKSGGDFPTHYVADTEERFVERLLRSPRTIASGTRQPSLTPQEQE